MYIGIQGDDRNWCYSLESFWNRYNWCFEKYILYWVGLLLRYAVFPPRFDLYWVEFLTIELDLWLSQSNWKSKKLLNLKTWSVRDQADFRLNSLWNIVLVYCWERNIPLQIDQCVINFENSCDQIWKWSETWLILLILVRHQSVGFVSKLCMPMC